ncbi:MAG TPA: hypothetical protein PKM51_04710 [Chitinophagales bacterium]|nr:hypothetical protein [Chitinophagales bacterium]HNM32029.1 hypothetical protein [Chitinophagales bacterium]
MKTERNTYNIKLIIGLITAAVIYRIIPHPFNITPLIAVSLFSGAKVEDKRFAFIIPIVTLFVSDILLAYMNNYPVLHSTILFTYGSIALIVLLGRLLNKDKSFNSVKIAGLSITSSFLFFIITNFGVWLLDNMYPMNISGLVSCYVMAIPFNKFSWLGDLVFTMAIFGAYELISHKLTAAKVKL